MAEHQPVVVASELIKPFARLMRKGKTPGEIAFQKAWLQTIVACVEVGTDIIRIIGDEASLQTITTGPGSTAAFGVRTAARKWRPSLNKDANSSVIGIVG